MNLVTLNALLHRQQECIGISFSNIDGLNAVTRKLPNIKWSRTHNCWYVPMSKEHYSIITQVLKGIAAINNRALYVYLQNKKKAVLQPADIKTFHNPKKLKSLLPLPVKPAEPVHSINEHVLPALVQMLRLMDYSNSTIIIYTGEMRRFLVLLKHKAADTLTTAAIKRLRQSDVPKSS